MSFIAAYYGPCGYGDRIEPGDQVTYEDGELVHVTCTEQTITTEKPCADCHLVHAGGCDW